MSFNELKALIESKDTINFANETETISDSIFLSRDNVGEDNDEIGRSLLDWAAIYNRPEIAKFLSEKHPTLLKPSMQQRSAVHYAAKMGSSESLQVLINRFKNLEHKDHEQKTALELSIEFSQSKCARILLNHGAELPTDIESLCNLIKFYKLHIYCEPEGTYELVTEEEIWQLKVMECFQPRESYFKKIDCEKIESTLLTLIDKYQYLCNRSYKEERQEKYCDPIDTNVESKVELSKAKRKSLLKIIRFIIAVDKNICNLDQSSLVNDKFKTSESELLKYIKCKQTLKEQYFGDDLSSDSDSDEKGANSRHSSIPKHILDNSNDKIKRKYQHLKIQITKDLTNFKKKSRKIRINSDLKGRAEIIYDESDRENVSKIINEINSCSPERLHKLDEVKQIFIFGTRGINYMLDRWNANARRYHRTIDERGQPQYSESVLKTLPYDYYTDLDPKHDFHVKESNEADLLQHEADNLRNFLRDLHNSGPCISSSATRKDKSYLYNSVSDCLQDHFSNNVDDYLKNLASKRKHKDSYWKTNLKNSFNPSIAIAARPYHALKYTFGLKDYYPRSLLPRYWNNGKIEYSHVGKVYLSLHPLQDILSRNGPNNLSVQDRQARVSLGDQISPEKELSFVGYMPKDLIFHQLVAKFPSFKDDWKEVYESKYGLDREIYEGFKGLIGSTSPETDDRNQVLNLLAEWLCAWYEVSLIEIAKKEALNRNGILVYLDRDQKLTLTPENGRVFTRGNNNSRLRNEVHIMRELRIEITKHLDDLEQNTTSIPTFSLIKLDQVINKLKKLVENEEFLKTITSKVNLTLEEKGQLSKELYKRQPSEEQSNELPSEERLKIFKAELVIKELIDNEFYSKTMFT